jgi:sugar phosphate isomerase/epimerase
LKLGQGVHLSYCSNIHAGESWSEVRANLERHTLAVRDRLCPGEPFGLGLRLSALAVDALAEPAALAECRQFLDRQGLYVFTLNAFPYGPFHGVPVKDKVYLPDWRNPERLRYTNRAAEVLAQLLPDTVAEGSVSSVPGAYKAALDGPADVDRMVEHLLQHVAHLVALNQRGGRRIALALEPEPDCFLETLDEVLAFFGSRLHTPQAAERVAALSGLSLPAAAEALRQHLGLCLDLCHAAVEFEDVDDVLVRLRDAGIRVPKVQLSAGLRVPALDAPALAALQRFVDPVYLHQVVQRGPAGLRRFPDLPDALAAAGAGDAQQEWRVHFHVPLFLSALENFFSTQAFVRAFLARQRAQAFCTHLEVETYTWDVLPAAYRSGPIDEAIARELDWVRGELAA